MGMRVNGIDVLFPRTATLQEVVNRFNAETWRTGVTAAIRPEGGFTLTSANTFTYIGMGVTVGDAAAWLGLPSAFATTMTVAPRQLQAVSTDGTAYRILNLPGTLTVTPRPIEVTANGGSSSYGDAPANPGLSATGLVNGDTLSGLSNSFGIGNLTGAGSYTLNVNGTFSNANYTITSRNTGTWTVNPAQITVTANGGSSVYGDAPSNPGFSVSGLRNGDTSERSRQLVRHQRSHRRGQLHAQRQRHVGQSELRDRHPQQRNMDGQSRAGHRDRQWRQLGLRQLADKSGPDRDGPAQRRHLERLVQRIRH